MGVVYQILRKKVKFNPFWIKTVTQQTREKVKWCEYFLNALNREAKTNRVNSHRDKRVRERQDL